VEIDQVLQAAINIRFLDGRVPERPSVSLPFALEVAMFFRHCTIILVLVAIVCPRLSAQVNPSSSSQPSETQAANKPALQSRDQRYRLERGDVFDLDFAFTPDFNQIVTVQPDGYISLRSVGDVKIVGQTIPEASETIRAAYLEVLNNPKVVIMLKDFEKPYFIAGGWVEKPGRYDLRGETTLSQAIQVAGGLKDGAKPSQVILFRSVSSDLVEVKKLNLKTILAGKNLTEDVHLKPGDMFLVPQSVFAKIAPYIPRASIGTYFNPGGF
jgi:polysaccharide export outer membrane protein